jgi:hypothetical protein
VTTLEAALNYASRGWRVIPILAGGKRPALTRWTEQATTHQPTIEEWWDGHAEYNVGLATGPESGFWVLDVDDIDALHDLEERHGKLPDTRTSITGSGGYHLLYRWPIGLDIRNDAGRRLGHGLDVRGSGGQIVVPPSIHPNGTEYAWDLGQPREAVDAPDWLIDLVTTEPVEPGVRERTAAARSDRPGDQFAAATTWAELLEADGWTLHHVDRDGEHHWTRPGKDTRDGTSATTGYMDSDVLKVFTSSMRAAGLTEEETYTKLGYLASTRFDGDHGAAAAFLSAQGWGERFDPEELLRRSHRVDSLARDTIQAVPEVKVAEDTDLDGHWEFVDIGAILDGQWIAPTPTMLRRTDGVGLLYPGRVHSLQGEPGGGKTWIALFAAAETMRADGRVLFIDYEDTAGAAVNRLLQLGVPEDYLRHQFVYVKPDGPLMDKSGRVAGPTLARMLAVAPTLSIIDSVGESIAYEGLNPSADEDVAQWFRLLPRPLARTGSSVFGMDHLAKDTEKRGLWAIGSQRKLAAIDGAAYNVQVIKAPTKGSDGHLKLLCAKDRHGTHQRGATIAAIHITDQDGGVAVELRPMPTTFRPTHLMERISRLVEEEPGLSGKKIEAGVKGNNDAKRLALRMLTEEGFLRTEPIPNGGFYYHSERSFREEDELLGVTAPTAPEPRPEDVGRGPNRDRAHRAPGYLQPGRGGARLEDQETGSQEGPRPTAEVEEVIADDILGLFA